jgi:sugar lactone lactonase YvrE
VSALEQELNRRRLAQIGLATSAAIAGAGNRALAQDATPEGEGGLGLPPLPEGATVIAEGLYNPGNLAFGPDGTLYIAETGVAGGGEEPPAGTPDPNATPVQTPAPLVLPRISQVAPDGTQSVLTYTFGGVGIAVYNGEVYAATGGTSVSMGMIPNPEENTVSAINIETGETHIVASLGEYEVENNPDETDVNPNLYGLDITDDGEIYVADAGGNTLYAVDAATGAYELFAVVPDLTELTGAEPDPEFGVRQPVPTSVVIDDGGLINVGLLAEGWEGPGILSYSPDGTYEVGISGLAMTVSAALGSDGLIYVSQLTADFSGEMPAPGNVFRINADGTVETVVEGLFFPHGIAFDTAGNLYVAVNSIISAPDAPAGQVIRIDGIAV